MNDFSPRILVAGAGSVGVFFASKLAQQGAKVSVIARSDYDALKKNAGHYKILSCKGDYTFEPEHIYRSANEVDFEPDILLAAYKVLPGLNPAELIRSLIGEKTKLFIIQNGINNELPFYRAFPENEIIGAVAYVGAMRPEPGTIRHLDGGSIFFGRYPAELPLSQTATLLCDAFKAAGIESGITPDIGLRRWIKLLWNAPYNSISVLGRSADTSIIMGDPAAVKLAEDIMREVIEIAKAEGYEIPNENIEKNSEYTRKFAAYKPSTLQDFEAGRKIELEAILGEPLRVADKHGIEAPHMRTLYALLKLAARGQL